MSISPDELKFNCMKIYRLIQICRVTLICYIIDVPEDEVKKMDGSDLSYNMEQVSSNPKKENGKKVWFRGNIVRFLRLWTNFGYLCCCLS
jgi:hypothetical protein